MADDLIFDLRNFSVKPFRTLLFYKYVHIENAEQFAAAHLQWCITQGLKGRVLVAEEGLNGTISGTIDQTQAYMDHL
ncbi:MAG: hypothetical protein JST18_01650, partial [Bacteroidetes bacterium]|nr:hypothetical protein [Bacteroidota bacterium]